VQYLSDGFVDHDPPLGLPPDAEGMRTAASMFRPAFPDWHSDLEARVTSWWSGSRDRTHRGELFGVAPTGQGAELRGINIFRLRDGRISERWGPLDELGLLQQLGLAA
jgi:predicted ester cyclase